MSYKTKLPSLCIPRSSYLCAFVYALLLSRMSAPPCYMENAQLFFKVQLTWNVHCLTLFSFSPKLRVGTEPIVYISILELIIPRKKKSMGLFLLNCDLLKLEVMPNLYLLSALARTDPDI